MAPQIEDFAYDQPLVDAVVKDDYAYVKARLRKGASVDVRGDDGYPLNYKLQNASQRLLELLITHGMDINAANFDGLPPAPDGTEDEGPLMTMIELGRLEADGLERLLHVGAMPERGFSDLVRAIGHVKDEERALGLAAVADQHFSPQMRAEDARFYVSVAIINALRNANYRLAERFLEMDGTIMPMYLPALSTYEPLNFALRLGGLTLDSPVDENSSMRLGDYLLTEATLERNVALMQELLARGADPDAEVRRYFSHDTTTARRAAQEMRDNEALLWALDAQAGAFTKRAYSALFG